MKAEVGKLNTNKLVIAPTYLNNLKTKLDGLDFGELKAVPVDLQKIKWCSRRIRNTKLKALNTTF